MTADEIVTVVDVLQAAWPWAEWSDKTIALWCDAISDLDAGVGLCIARRVTRKHDKPPSIAVFLAEAHAEWERRRPADRREIEAPVSPAGAQQFIASAREALARQATAKHKHGGPNPCQVCGGLKGTLGDQRTSDG